MLWSDKLDKRKIVLFCYKLRCLIKSSRHVFILNQIFGGFLCLLSAFSYLAEIPEIFLFPNKALKMTIEQNLKEKEKKRTHRFLMLLSKKNTNSLSIEWLWMLQYSEIRRYNLLLGRRRKFENERWPTSTIGWHVNKEVYERAWTRKAGIPAIKTGPLKT